YVNSELFIACSPQALDAMVACGFRATHACACWVLQHCIAPEEDLARIESSLAPAGSLYILNLNSRAVPTQAGWASDGISVEDLLRRRFDVVTKGRLPPSVTTAQISEGTYTMTVRKRA